MKKRDAVEKKKIQLTYSVKVSCQYVVPYSSYQLFCQNVSRKFREHRLETP